jgi:4-alpha-glucanotransferase
MASVADIAMIPLQDVLGLGSEARMNLPGRVSGNWKWRFKAGAFTSEMQSHLLCLAQMYDR